MGMNIHMEQALQGLLSEARAEADELRERKNEYERILLSTRLIMGHELKKPATAVTGYIELALEELESSRIENADAVVEYLRKARNECHLLNELNTFFLELLKVDRQTVFLEGAVVAIRDFVSQIVDHLPDGLKANERVTTRIAPDVNKFHIHPNALRIIITNLLENALKYSDGQVFVRIQTQNDKRGLGEGKLLNIQVSDGGEGIPEPYMQRVFSPFVRLRADTDGAGLGLTLVRSLVELNGGNVHIRSEEGSGTVVQLALPEIVERAETAETP